MSIEHDYKPGDLVRLNELFYPKTHVTVGLLLVINIFPAWSKEAPSDAYSEKAAATIPTSRTNKNIMTFYFHDLVMVLSV